MPEHEAPKVSPAKDPGEPAKHTDSTDKHTDALTWLIIITIVASMLVAGIGIQAYYSKKEDERQRACFGVVVSQLTAALNVRSSASVLQDNAQQSLDHAEAVKEAALDRIIFVVYRGRQPGADPVALNRAFGHALSDFRDAKRQVDREKRNFATVSKQVGNLRDVATYPDASACGVVNPDDGPATPTVVPTPQPSKAHQKPERKTK